MPEVSAEAWDEFLRAQPHPHLLQTSRWGDLKSAFGWSAARVISGESGAQILFRKLAFGFTLAYIPRGPIGQDWSQLLPELDRICRSRHAVLLKVEPDAWLDARPDANDPPDGFTASPHAVQPPRTIVLDIDLPDDQILAQMRQKTRYNISLARRRGVEVAPTSDVPAFHRMAEITGERNEFGVHSGEYYERAYDLFHPHGMCELFLAYFDGVAIAGLMAFAVASRAWYFYGASTEEERNRMPAYLLQWEAIRWARRSGCTEYDLWGVPDETLETLEENFITRRDGLWGVYRFKRGFGGQLRRAAGPWDRIYQPALYQAYRRMAGRRGG